MSCANGDHPSMDINPGNIFTRFSSVQWFHILQGPRGLCTALRSHYLCHGCRFVVSFGAR